MAKNYKVVVQNFEVRFVKGDHADFILLTDIAKYRNAVEPFSVINNWMRSRSTIDFLGLWEKLNNPSFKPIEFDRFRIDTSHTDAVQKHIIPVSKFKGNNEWIAYAEEADILNMALFGCTAKEWREANAEHALDNRNIRDFASINELAVLSNLETLNAEMIKGKIEKNTRYVKLKEIAGHQLEVLSGTDMLKSIKELDESTYTNGQKN